MKPIVESALRDVRTNWRGIFSTIVVSLVVSLFTWAVPYWQAPNGFPVLLPHTILGTFFILWPLFRRGMRRGWSLKERYSFAMVVGPIVGAALPPLIFVPQLMILGAGVAAAETILWVVADWCMFGRHEPIIGALEPAKLRREQSGL